MAGKPRAVKTAADLEKIVDEYILFIKGKNSWLDGRYNPEEDRPVFPSRASFQTFSTLSPQCVSDYATNKEDRYTGYAEVLKKLVYFREDFLNQLVMLDPKRYTTICIFLLKQPMFGGYVDKPTMQVETRELTIKTGDGMPKDSFQ